MKKSRSISITVISSMLILAILAVGFYISRPQFMAGASNRKSPPTLSSQEKNILPTSQPYADGILSASHNDITVDISSVKILKTGIEIGICYTTLDGGDWYPVPGHLFYGTNEVFPDEYEFTAEQKADANNPGKRCALVRYRLNDLSALTPPIKFSVIGFDAHPQEMYSPCQNFMHRLDTSQKAKAYGLKAKCSEAGNGEIVVTLVGNNKSVEKELASQILNEIAKGTITGSWEFTIDELEK